MIRLPDRPSRQIVPSGVDHVNRSGNSLGCRMTGFILVCAGLSVRTPELCPTKPTMPPPPRTGATTVRIKLCSPVHSEIDVGCAPCVTCSSGMAPNRWASRPGIRRWRAWSGSSSAADSPAPTASVESRQPLDVPLAPLRPGYCPSLPQYPRVSGGRWRTPRRPRATL